MTIPSFAFEQLQVFRLLFILFVECKYYFFPAPVSVFRSQFIVEPVPTTFCSLWPAIRPSSVSTI